MLFVRLIGEISLYRGAPSAPIALPASKKTRALFAFLVASRAPQPRQRLCDLLWDGPDDPRAALRWSLTKLRPLVDEPAAIRIVADRERVGFEAMGARVDLFEASALLSRGVGEASTDALRSASAMLTGELLEGLELPDCYRFHEWCTAERERVRKVRLEVLDALVERLAANAPEDALDYARQRVASDPLSDVAHAAVVRLLARLGRRSEAQAQLDTGRRILDRELNGRASPALDLARLEIGRSSTPASIAPPSLSSPPPPPTSEAPRRAPSASRALVGRSRERGVLERLANEASAGAASDVVLLNGEAGIGKSRLLDDFADRLRRAGGIVLASRAFEAESVRAYGVWVDMLRGLALAGYPADLLASLTPLLPELGNAEADVEGRTRMFDGVARLLRILSEKVPVGIIVDDLHWLDEASSGLLHYVARVTCGSRIAIACATREGELSDNSAALRLVRGLRRDERLVQLDLEPLDEAETAELVQSSFPALDAARVFRESGGNPLFVIEVARSFTLARDGESRDTPALEALLQERLARLHGRASDLVMWAAALGRQFDPQLLVRVTGDNFGQTIGAIGDLEQSGILTSADGRAYSFTHELVRKAAYQRLEGPRRRLVHGSIARTLAADPAPGAAWGDIVHHATLADDAALAARACVAAAQRCLALHARTQARDFAARGLAQAKKLDGADGLSVRLGLLRILGYTLGGDISRDEEFEQDAREALGLARDLGRAEDEATALTVLSCFRHVHDDDEGARRSSLGAADAALRMDSVASLATMAHSGFCLVLIEKDLPRARALLDEAHEIASARRLAILDVELGMGTLLHFEGDPAPARSALERASQLARANADSWQESVAVTRLAMIALEAGDWALARTHAGALREVAKHYGDGAEGAIANALDAVASHGSAPVAARAAVRDAMRDLETADAKAMLAFVLTVGAETELRARLPEGLACAEDWARRALEAAIVMGRPSAIVLGRAALGQAAFQVGDRERARTELVASEALAIDPSAMSMRARHAISTLERSFDDFPITRRSNR